MNNVEKQENLQKKKILGGRVFDPDIVDQSRMQELMEMVEFQRRENMFKMSMPSTHESNVNCYHPRPSSHGGIGRLLASQPTCPHDRAYPEY
ncbi:hypothetical protein HAX54_017568 [Datura stramonium]|uniref:Uncharacterized protein n=1 Tax=Datura stramonium TaxID=4076 RepID=A0ABS8UL35_DATST|nr:hypothetical protein [Datura stramonium]